MARHSDPNYPPLREYWQDNNRRQRRAQAESRAKRKDSDKKRRKCTCDAYKFPHRPGGGLCRFPDPPLVRWQETQAAEIAERTTKFTKRFGEPAAEHQADLAAMTTKPTRPYRSRYTGILRQIARNNGLHPIRDRDIIRGLLPQLKECAKQMKRQAPKWKFKYRNMEIINNGNGTYGLRAVWTTAGPTM